MSEFRISNQNESHSFHSKRNDPRWKSIRLNQFQYERLLLFSLILLLQIKSKLCNLIQFKKKKRLSDSRKWGRRCHDDHHHCPTNIDVISWSWLFVNGVIFRPIGRLTTWITMKLSDYVRLSFFFSWCLSSSSFFFHIFWFDFDDYDDHFIISMLIVLLAMLINRLVDRCQLSRYNLMQITWSHRKKNMKKKKLKSSSA